VEVSLDAAYISALFGLGGATVGALASFTTTWMTHHVQFRDRLREEQRTRRVDLFKEFIDEASRLYGDAMSHERDDVGDLVLLYAILARMELMAPRETVEAGRRVIDAIIGTYLAPNRSLHEIRELAAAGKLDILAEFGAICRECLET
jgi:hypothetical protein